MSLSETQTTEAERAASLQEAQDKADALFNEIARDLIRPGITEKQLSDEIHALGQKRHNVKTHWHKRVVRSGPNTLQPYAGNPPDRTIGEDDILFVDLGPVFEKWEADFGRTFVLGSDPIKLKLRDSLSPAWHAVKSYFSSHPDCTGEELYIIAGKVAKEHGWEFGNVHAGHLVGDFPHERIPSDKVTLYITKGNGEKMRTKGKGGWMRHWILEMHLVDRERGVGGFMEQLLTVG